MNLKVSIAAVLLGLVAGVGCGTDSPNTEPAAATVSTMSARDVAYNAALEQWNKSVGEWNELTKARDAGGGAQVVVDGRPFELYTDWAKAFGKPTEMPTY